jgi:hypothetical protein
MIVCFLLNILISYYYVVVVVVVIVVIVVIIVTIFYYYYSYDAYYSYYSYFYYFIIFMTTIHSLGSMIRDLIHHERSMFLFISVLVSHETDDLDGSYWTKFSPKDSHRMADRTGPSISHNNFPDQKIITRLSNLITIIERMKCSAPNCQGTLTYVGYMANVYTLNAKCSVCSSSEKIPTLQMVTLKHCGKTACDLPYLEAVASRFIPGGGVASQCRMNSILGLPTLGHTALNSFYQGPLLGAIKAVHENSIRSDLAAVIDNALKRFPNADGVSKFYPISVEVDARWDKPWGWNALNSTIRMIETTTKLVMATITLHRKDSSPNKYAQSAKSCDSEGSARCLKEITARGFDVIEVIHDDDSSSMKRLIATKAELSSMPNYAGKISSEIRESLCTRYEFYFTFTLLLLYFTLLFFYFFFTFLLLYFYFTLL